jgi:hypothetical protein
MIVLEDSLPVRGSEPEMQGEVGGSIDSVLAGFDVIEPKAFRRLSDHERAGIDAV